MNFLNSLLKAQLNTIIQLATRKYRVGETADKQSSFNAGKQPLTSIPLRAKAQKAFHIFHNKYMFQCQKFLVVYISVCVCMSVWFNNQFRIS